MALTHPRTLWRRFCIIFPLLSSGGVYVAEDLHCSYWPSFGGGVLSNESAMAFFKVLLDLIHRDYWPQDYENDVLRSFEPDIRISVARLAPLLASIESIEFRGLNVLHTARKRIAV